MYSALRLCTSLPYLLMAKPIAHCPTSMSMLTQRLSLYLRVLLFALGRSRRPSARWSLRRPRANASWRTPSSHCCSPAVIGQPCPQHNHAASRCVRARSLLAVPSKACPTRRRPRTVTMTRRQAPTQLTWKTSRTTAEQTNSGRRLKHPMNPGAHGTMNLQSNAQTLNQVASNWKPSSIRADKLRDLRS